MSDAAIRDLERAARDAPSAASWSRLATALSRAGRDLDAYQAAVRTLLLDPRDPARTLLRPEPATLHPGDSVPWSGLARPGTPRVVSAVAQPSPQVFDLGDGLVATHPSFEDGHVQAIDVFTGEERWCTDGTTGEQIVVGGRAGDSLVLLANPTEASVELVLLDRRTGEVTRRERFALPLGPFLWPPSPSDVSVHGERAPVLLFGANVTSEASPCRFRIEPDRIVAEPCVAFATLWVAPCAAGIVIQSGEDTVAIGEGGRELWRLADWKLIDVSGAALVRRGPMIRTVEPTSGALIAERTDASLDGHWWGGSSSGPCFVLGRSELDEKSPDARYDLVLVALDRKTLEVRWRGRHIGYSGLASTADLTIVATHPRTQDTATVVTALDAATGAARWRFEAPRASGAMTPSLSAGHLILSGHGHDPLVIVPPAP